jgi:hypothetical protein
VSVELRAGARIGRSRADSKIFPDAFRLQREKRL